MTKFFNVKATIPAVSFSGTTIPERTFTVAKNLSIEEAIVSSDQLLLANLSMTIHAGNLAQEYEDYLNYIGSPKIKLEFEEI